MPGCDRDEPPSPPYAKQIRPASVSDCDAGGRRCAAGWLNNVFAAPVTVLTRVAPDPPILVSSKLTRLPAIRRRLAAGFSNGQPIKLSRH